MEVVQAIIQPVLQMVVAWFAVGQGWIRPEAVAIVWAVVAISVVASLGALVASWLLEYPK